MDAVRIKIGHQEQANEAIYLCSRGQIVCGGYTYAGKRKKEFRRLYDYIKSTVKYNKTSNVIDISGFKLWTAIDIYDEFILIGWRKSIGAKKLERLAIETKIFSEIELVREEFKIDVAKQWKKIFRKSDINNPATPTQAWHIFRNPRLQSPA